MSLFPSLFGWVTWAGCLIHKLQKYPWKLIFRVHVGKKGHHIVLDIELIFALKKQQKFQKWIFYSKKAQAFLWVFLFFLWFSFDSFVSLGIFFSLMPCFFPKFAAAKVTRCWGGTSWRPWAWREQGYPGPVEASGKNHPKTYRNLEINVPHHHPSVFLGGCLGKIWSKFSGWSC